MLWVGSVGDESCLCAADIPVGNHGDGHGTLNGRDGLEVGSAFSAMSLRTALPAMYGDESRSCGL
jgi:hypothetical protein